MQAVTSCFQAQAGSTVVYPKKWCYSQRTHHPLNPWGTGSVHSLLQEALAASKLSTGLRACQYLATAVLVWRWWGSALTTVDPAATWPLTSWIMAPHAGRFRGSGAVCMLSWVTLSRWTGQALCKAVLV